jgi:hypothetical protein
MAIFVHLGSVSRCLSFRVFGKCDVVETYPLDLDLGSAETLHPRLAELSLPQDCRIRALVSLAFSHHPSLETQASVNAIRFGRCGRFDTAFIPKIQATRLIWNASRADRAERLR